MNHDGHEPDEEMYARLEPVSKRVDDVAQKAAKAIAATLPKMGIDLPVTCVVVGIVVRAEGCSPVCSAYLIGRGGIITASLEAPDSGKAGLTSRILTVLSDLLTGETVSDEVPS